MKEKFFIRSAVAADLTSILAIYHHARLFMAANGNPDQWGTGRPSQEEVERNIEAQHMYVTLCGQEIVGVFAFLPGPDPTYQFIEGAWLNDREYGVVHRIASAGVRQGVAAFELNWAFDQCRNLRIDTHEKNLPMQGLLSKLEFTKCGTIYLANGAPRWAYQKTM